MLLRSEVTPASGIDLLVALVSTGCRPASTLP